MSSVPRPPGGLRFLRQILDQPLEPAEASLLESMLLQAELEVLQEGLTELPWSTLLTAAETYWHGLTPSHQAQVGTPRDILHRWGLNAGFYLEVDEARNRLRVHPAD